MHLINRILLRLKVSRDKLKNEINLLYNQMYFNYHLLNNWMHE